ncbi:MAG TPA: hypothetical protein P5552_12390 [Candidatus Competibacteraceae bacterium]|nr:hypothetical protein [Candidatus Competibacteraceae bacterium]
MLDAGTDLVDIQALLGHESVAATQIDTHVGPARMEQGVARCDERGKTGAALDFSRDFWHTDFV